MMESSKNYFEKMAETQNKLIENWLDTTKKFQKSATSGEGIQDGKEIVQDWQKRQQDIFKESMNAESKPKANGKAASSSVDKGANNTADMYKNWMEMQSGIAKQWMEMAGQSKGNQTKNMSFSPEEMMKQGVEAYNVWNNMYQQWYSQFGKNFEDMSRSLRNPMAGQTFEGMMNQTKTYIKMQEMWRPVMDNMKKGVLSMEQVKEMLSKGKMTEMLQNMFGFMDSKSYQPMVDQMNSFMKMYFDGASKFSDQMKGQFGKMMPGMGDGQFSNMAEFSQSLTEQMQKMYSPFFQMMPPSKDKEKMTAMMGMQDSFAKYWSKSSDMQAMVQKETWKVMEKLAEDMIALAKKGEKIPEFKEFYNDWINLMEERLIALFRTEAFSKVQGEMLDANMKIKLAFNKQMESAMAPYPIIRKSEFDDLSKVVHELRRKVRTLETELKSAKSTSKGTTSKAANTKDAAKKADSKDTTSKSDSSDKAKSSSSSSAKSDSNDKAKSDTNDKAKSSSSTKASTKA